MPLPDEQIRFAIEGDCYEYKSWDGKDWVPVAGTYGPEYAGEFVLRHRDRNDKDAITNAVAMRFPVVNATTPGREIDVATAIFTVLQVARAVGNGPIGKVPTWFAPERLGTDLDEIAALHVMDKFQDLMNGRKKNYAAPSSSPSASG